MVFNRVRHRNSRSPGPGWSEAPCHDPGPKARRSCPPATTPPARYSGHLRHHQRGGPRMSRAHNARDGAMGTTRPEPQPFVLVDRNSRMDFAVPDHWRCPPWCGLGGADTWRSGIGAGRDAGGRRRSQAPKRLLQTKLALHRSENTRWKTEAKISPKSPARWVKCLLLPPISGRDPVSRARAAGETPIATPRMAQPRWEPRVRNHNVSLADGLRRPRPGRCNRANRT